jgi:hypothetical protein
MFFLAIKGKAIVESHTLWRAVYQSIHSKSCSWTFLKRNRKYRIIWYSLNKSREGNFVYDFKPSFLTKIQASCHTCIEKIPRILTLTFLHSHNFMQRCLDNTCLVLVSFCHKIHSGFVTLSIMINQKLGAGIYYFLNLCL